jgi:3-carboxy-cis,cis-muconate cycloisomerase
MVSGFEHPWLAGLLGDEETAALIGPDAEVAAMVHFEVALAEAEAERGVIPREAGARIAAALAGFRPDIDALRAGTARDGVVVPELVRQLRDAAGAEAAWVHFGATSQDVIDTALVLRLKPVLALHEARLAALVAALDELAARCGDRPLMARTRMQAAIPITAGDRIASWRAPLARGIERLAALRDELLVVQFGGAAGTLDRLGAEAAAVRAGLAARLGLRDAPQWQSQRDRIAALGGWLALVTGSLGKLGQDVALMAQDGGEIRLTGGGGSSAMAHKQNPVMAEVLVALARFNAAQVGGLHQAMVHEQERSGAAWTLEWLLLPPMLLATGAALRTAARLVAAIVAIGG